MVCGLAGLFWVVGAAPEGGGGSFLLFFAPGRNPTGEIGSVYEDALYIYNHNEHTFHRITFLPQVLVTSRL